MPPKKDLKQGAKNATAENDLTDVAGLPLINDFVFTTMYAFKYRRTQAKVEEALRQELDLSLQPPSTDPEIMDAQKRNKVILMKDLIENSDSRGYMTAAEFQENKDPTKVQQALARSTNDILVSLQLPLRREKQTLLDQFAAQLSAVTDATEKERLQIIQAEKLKRTELTVWLKDFPKNAADFKELRRSAAQHIPEIDIAIHASILIEEKFKRNYDEEAEVVGGENREISAEQLAEETAIKAKIQEEEFSNTERQNVYKDLLFINKYAQNCPVTSQMKLLLPEKISFKGPDPPPEDWKVNDNEAAQIEAPPVGKAPPKGKLEQNLPPPEVPKSPEVEAAEKAVRRFMKQFMTNLLILQADLNQYRGYTQDVKKVALWPKKLTQQEIQAIKDKDEAERKAIEQAEALAAQEAAAAAVANGGKGGKGPAPATKQPVTTPRPSSSSKQQEQSRPGTSASTRQKIEQAAAMSVDDDPKEWNFEYFNRVVNDMKAESTSVGSIMAAMIYQIEEQNKQRTQIQGQTSQSNNKSSTTILPQTGINKGKDILFTQLDSMFEKVAFETAAISTDFKHQFKQEKIVSQESLPNANSSPYQTLIQTDNKIAIHSDSFKFLNGREQGHYEASQLEHIEVPTINSRVKITQSHTNQTKQIAERESDISEIVGYCKDVTESQVRRMVTLKQFQDLLQSANPERTYNFMDRNYLETYDNATFRQVLTDALVMEPDVITCYFEKEEKESQQKQDCLKLLKKQNAPKLLMALNFKNPPGRLLRRQWTQPLASVPDYHHWRMFKDQIQLPKKVLNIPMSNLSVIRQNQKYCFPCDNSVIRICKNYIGSRCFGSSLIIKDNFVFGVKETQANINEKVSMEDQILNFETKKTTDRRCEFWLEFENGTKMFAEMIDPVSPNLDLIPPSEQEGALRIDQIRKEVTIIADEQIAAASSRTENRSLGNENKSILKSSLGTRKNEMDPTNVTFDQNQAQDDLNIKQPPIGKIQESDELDSYNKDKGASLTFTYKEGIIVQILPNGSVQQTIAVNSETAKKQAVIQADIGDEVPEIMRTVTREGSLIRYLKDGNQIIYFRDGTITKTDHRRGIWTTTNAIGIVRERNLRTKVVRDEIAKLQINKKVDPETAAVVNIREDGFLKIDYADGSTLIIFADHTKIYVVKSASESEESRVIQTYFEKEGYSTVKITFDPIKARAQTIIGLGGADALMGRDGIMERSNGGLVSEVFLPDRSVIQTYFERQELPGVNKTSKSLIHLIRRDDFSVIKVRQDGEIVLVTANERAFLNNIGKQQDFGISDYDYFFEIFGMPLERRSGVYTANLEQGRVWTQDEEGNFFIIYANGQSTQKLSVSFNLDQMIEGIENKEPDSPRIPDGEYIEEECKFLPPPKSVGHPRLFLVNGNSAIEYSNYEQLEYQLRSQEKDEEFKKTHTEVNISNERVTSHHFMKEEKKFNASNPPTLNSFAKPRIPQALEMVNQTVSIPSEPERHRYFRKNLLQFQIPSNEQIQSLYHAIGMRDSLRQRQKKEAERLSVKARDLPLDQLEQQTKIWLRIAKQRGIHVETLIDREYQSTKELDRDTKRVAAFNKLDSAFTSAKQSAESTDSS